MANGPKCATCGATHVFPTNHDPLYTKTLSFWFRALPLVCVLKRKLGPGGGGGGSRYPPSRGHHMPHPNGSRFVDYVLSTVHVDRAVWVHQPLGDGLEGVNELPCFPTHPLAPTLKVYFRRSR